MDLNDIKEAVTDLIEYHGHKPTETVYLLGERYGINGIDATDGKLYVLSEDGKPAVSNREYKRLKAEIDRLKGIVAWNVSCVICVNQIGEEWVYDDNYGELLCDECFENRYGGDGE